MRLTRKKFLQSGALAATALWLDSRDLFAARKSGGPGKSFLRAYSPIDRTVLEESPAVFFGDDPGLHEAVRDGKFLMDDAVVEPRRERLVVIGGGISGLSSAYLLRDFKPLVLEAGARFGGNSRGQSWRGNDYSIGAAYFVPPEPGTERHALFAALGLNKEWRLHAGGPEVFSAGGLKSFWDGAGASTPADKEMILAVGKFLAQAKFPQIPMRTLEERKLAFSLDKESFAEHLRKALPGLSGEAQAMVELYCWTALGGSASEVGAAFGLNFLAGEGAGIAVLPGGNARVAERLFEALAYILGEDRLRANSPVFRVAPGPDGVVVQYADAAGTPREIRADAVIMAVPKFIAGRLVEGLHGERAEDFKRLKYRSYLVANALIEGAAASPDTYEVFMLGEPGLGPARTQEESLKRMATDFLFGTFARQNAKDTVLTIYRALPFDGARDGLLAPDSFAKHSAEFKEQAKRDILPGLGISPAALKGWRFSRFGHPLPLAETGLLADGVCDRIRAPYKDKVFFVHQDNWMLPAIETSLSEVFEFESKVRDALA